MKVVLSSQPNADLARVARFIAQDNPPRAASFVAELRGVAARLADVPTGCPLVPRYERHGIRRRSWKDYGVLDAILPDRVFVYSYHRPRGRIITACCA